MRRALLRFVLLSGRYAVLAIFAVAALVFVGWLLLLDVSLVGFLLVAPIALPLACGALALIAGMLFSGVTAGRGTGVARDEAPELWKAIGDVFGPARTRNVRLFLTPNVEASISTSRRYLGFFGEVVDLNLGLPLFKVCDENDIKAVIRHEFAHVQHRDTNGSRNLAEFERTFETLFDFAPPGETILGTVTAVAFWHMPDLLAAEEAKLSREAELAADRAAARNDRPAELASALYRVEASGRFLARTVYEPIGKEIVGSMAPPTSALERILGLPDPICDPECFHRCWVESLDEVADPLASHPTTRQRLEALGMSPGWRIDPIETSALSAFVPTELLQRARAAFEERWQDDLATMYER
jgi:hypothetical protein